MKLSILQWNILYDEPLENICEFIKQIKPDILCLQELTKNFPQQRVKDAIKYLSEELGYDHYASQVHKWRDGKSQSNGIFSKYPVLPNAKSYVRQPEPGAEKDWSKEGRLYIEAIIKVGNKDITIGTTHLTYTSGFEWTKVKDQETRRLLKIIDTHHERYILTGDLNALPFSSMIKLVSQKLNHCGPPFEQNTFANQPFNDGRGFKCNSLRYRLDYIFSTADLKVAESQVLDTPYSDHLPVLVIFDV